MLTAAKNQIKTSFLTIKYALMREMLNKSTFISNVIFMILNNASFIVQWLILFNIKDDMGGYSFRQVMLLWGIAATGYGFAHFFFSGAFDLADLINNGKLDSFIVQPKNVLISAITAKISVSAIGDFIYGYIMLFIFGATITNFLLFTLFTITSGLILTSVAVIFASLSFWFSRADMIADTGNQLMTNFATYPDGIFKSGIKLLFYTIMPLGFASYLPIKVLTEFSMYRLMLILGATILFIALAFIIFYKGLKRYSSSNLMSAKF